MVGWHRVYFQPWYIFASHGVGLAGSHAAVGGCALDRHGHGGPCPGPGAAKREQQEGENEGENEGEKEDEKNGDKKKERASQMALTSALGELSFLPMETNTLKCLAHLDSIVDALESASEMIKLEAATSLVNDSLDFMTKLLHAV